MHALVALMTEDVWLRMPTVPSEYQARTLAARFFSTVAFRQTVGTGLSRPERTDSPLSVYLRHPVTGMAQVFEMLIVTLAGDQVSAAARFDNAAIQRLRTTENLTE